MWKQRVRYSKESWFQSAAMYSKKCLLSLVLLETAEIKWCMQTNSILGVRGLCCSCSTSLELNLYLTACPEFVYLSWIECFLCNSGGNWIVKYSLLLNIAYLKLEMLEWQWAGNHNCVRVKIFWKRSLERPYVTLFKLWVILTHLWPSDFLSGSLQKKMFMGSFHCLVNEWQLCLCELFFTIIWLLWMLCITFKTLLLTSVG